MSPVTTIFAREKNLCLGKGSFPISVDSFLGLWNRPKYVYDAVGNRISQTVNGVTTSYVVNNVNQYTSSVTNGVTTGYHYDLDGNLISQATGNTATTYTYNSAGQLAGVSSPSASLSYDYDAFGNRDSVMQGGMTINNVYDPTSGDLVAEFDGFGSLMAHYVNGLGLVSQINSSTTSYYYDFNNIGATVAITGPSGNCVNRYAYLPFGRLFPLSLGLRISSHSVVVPVP